MCTEVFFFTFWKRSNLVPAMWRLLTRAVLIWVLDFKGDTKMYLRSLWMRTHLWNWAKNLESIIEAQQARISKYNFLIPSRNAASL